MAEQAKATATISNLPQPPEMKSTEYLNAYKNWVYSAVTHIGTMEASVEIKLFKKIEKRNDEDAVEEVEEHPAMALLEYVNDFTTWNGLRQLTSAYRDLLGEAAWVLFRDGSGTPIEIWPLRPDWIKVVPDKEDFVKEYIYQPAGGAKEVVIPREDVIFFKDFSPTNPYRGYGKVKPGAYPLDIDEYADKYNRNFFFNNAMPNFLLTNDTEIPEEQTRRIVEGFRQQFGGVSNAHKMGVLAGGKWDVKELATAMKEIGYLESKSFLRDQILSMFQVSKANIGIVEDVNRANQEASDARLLKHVVKPNLTWFVGFLNEFYLNNWPGEGLYFDFEDPVPEDMDQKLAIYSSGLTYGWLTRNEVRAREGLEPLEGGDDVYISGQNNEDITPVELHGPKARVKKKWVIRGYRPKFKDVHKGEQKKKIKGDLVKLIGQIMQEVEVEEKNFQEESKMYYWKELVAETDIKEKILMQYIDQLSRDQEDIVMQKIAKHIKTLKDPRRYKLNPTTLLFGLKMESERWAKLLMPFIEKMVRDRGEKVLGGFGIQGFDINSEDVENYLNGLGADFVKEINETTRTDLIKTLSEGIANNEAPVDIRKRVIEVYENFRHTRAFNIARTETLRANNFATNEAYKQSGVVIKKEWLTAEDERACPWCGKMNGKVVGVEGNFFDKNDVLSVDGKKLDFSYGDVPTPPLHPQCRCTVIPITISQEKAQRIAEIKDSEEKIDKVAQNVLSKVEFIEKEEQKEEIKKSKEELEKEKEEIEREKQLLEQEKLEAEKEIEKERKTARQLKAEAEAEAKATLEKVNKLKEKAKAKYERD